MDKMIKIAKKAKPAPSKKEKAKKQAKAAAKGPQPKKPKKKKKHVTANKKADLAITAMAQKAALAKCNKDMALAKAKCKTLCFPNTAAKTTADAKAQSEK